MIQVELRSEADDDVIANVKMHHTPAKDEVIWLLGEGTHRSFKVSEVCHWVSEVSKEGYHHACIYVISL